MNEPVPCPFVHASGERCEGHIIRIEEYHNNDIHWEYQPNGTWHFGLREAVLGEPASHYRLFCSEKHDPLRPNSDQMKFRCEELEDAIRRIISAS